MSTTVQENQLNMAHQSCLICGCEDFSQGRIILQLQHSPDVFMQECPDCKAVSASRMPTDSYLNELYSPEVYQSALTEDDTLSKKCADNILKFYSHHGDDPITILDFGGGNGNLATAVIQALKNKYGEQVDVIATVVDIYPREDTATLHFATPEQFISADDRYNIVIASAVLEHIPTLNPVLTKLFSAGKQDALFYSRTPYDAPIAKFVSQYPIKWPRHVHDMGPVFWQQWTDRFPVDVLCSRTSIVESSFQAKPIAALIAHILKLPSRIETELIGRLFQRRSLLWHLVGGWEVFIRLTEKEAH